MKIKILILTTCLAVVLNADSYAWRSNHVEDVESFEKAVKIVTHWQEIGYSEFEIRKQRDGKWRVNGRKDLPLE